jgi:hypothetical protein
MKTYYVTPSDITFLWSDCPCCFYRKVAQGIHRPSGIFPKIFNRIDRAMKNCYVDKNLRDFSPDFPDAVYKYPDQWVQSKPLVVTGKDIQIVFRGKIDGLLEYSEKGADGKPIMGVPDLKTTEVDDNVTPMYGLALHTYLYCLENAADGEFSAHNVERLGLVVFEPSEYEHMAGEEPKLNGIHYWIEFEKDMESFKEWMKTLARVLSADAPPEPTKGCGYCNLLENQIRKQESAETKSA